MLGTHYSIVNALRSVISKQSSIINTQYCQESVNLKKPLKSENKYMKIKKLSQNA